MSQQKTSKKSIKKDRRKSTTKKTTRKSRPHVAESILKPRKPSQKN